MPETREKQLCDELGALKAQRVNFNSTWDRISRVVLPTMTSGFISTQAPGSNLNRDIFDSTAQMALPRFAAAIDTLVTPQTSKWHQLTPKTARLKRDTGVTTFLNDLNDLLFKVRYSPRANFASRANENYMSLGAFGTGITYVHDAMPGIRYRALNLAETWIDTDANGTVNRVFNEREYKLHQLVEHPIDPFVAVGAAKGLGQFHGFIDCHTIRNVEPLPKLPGANQDDAALDRADLFERTINMRLHSGDQRIGIGRHPGPQLAKEILVGPFEIGLSLSAQAHSGHFVPRDKQFIQSLHRELARPAPRRLWFGRFGGGRLVIGLCRSNGLLLAHHQLRRSVLAKVRVRPFLQQRHFDRRLCRLVALLLGTALGLLVGIGGQHPIADGHIQIKANAGDARRRFIANDFEVIGVTLDHATERNQRVELLGCRKRLQRQRNFQRTRHRHFGDIVGINAHFGQRLAGAGEQLFAHGCIEARGDNADSQSSAAEFHERLECHGCFANELGRWQCAASESN